MSLYGGGRRLRGETKMKKMLDDVRRDAIGRSREAEEGRKLCGRWEGEEKMNTFRCAKAGEKP